MKSDKQMKNALLKLVTVITVSIGFNHTNAQQMKDSIIHDTSFKIKEIPMDSYQGTYKNGKPYEGYFKKGDTEFYTVDFYEKGVPKYQYSMDILEQMEQNEFVLDKKATYKDSSIFNGPEVVLIKNGILCKNWNNGKLQGFTQDIFAMHYFNRLTFQKQRDTILITNLQEKEYKIELYLNANSWVAQLSHRDKVLLYEENVAHTATSFPKNSLVRLYVEDDVNKGAAYRYAKDAQILMSEANLSERIFGVIDISTSKNIDDAFDHILDTLITTQGFSEEKEYSQRPVIIGYFETDDNGTIKDGIRCLENKDNTVYHIYEKSKLIKEEKTTVDAFQEVFSNYIKKK